jgi:cation diffusion facilitator family transporter
VSEQGGSNRTVLIALAANALIAVAKGIAGAISGSGALMSEAAHSVADTMNEGFLLTALRRGDRPADERHPFGYGQERFVWSLLAAVGIFVAGAMFSFFEGYRTLSSGGTEHSGFLASYLVLGLAALLEGISWLRAVRQLRGEARAAGHGVVQHVRISDDPTVKTVASEDSAALVGILLAFLGILLHQLTGSHVYDGVASLLIGAVLVYVAFALGRDSMGLLTGESADPALRKRLVEELSAFDEVDEVIDLQTMRIGTGRLLVAVRLDFGPQLSSDEVEEASGPIEQQLHGSIPEVDQLFLDATAATESAAVARRSARRSGAPFSPSAD